jgi:hypothetical protein
MWKFIIKPYISLISIWEEIFNAIIIIKIEVIF